MDDPQPFILFGTSHLTTILAIVLVSTGLPLWVRRTGSERLAQRVALGMAVFLVVHEIYKTWMWVAIYDRPLAEHLPLQICGAAVFLSAIVLVWRQPRLFEVVYFWGLAGTLQAILTPDVPHAFPHPIYLVFFISHGMIIVAILYCAVVFRLRPTWSSIPRVLLITVLFAFLLVAPFNWLFDTNYMYLCRKPDAASILDSLGPWPWYLAGAAVLAVISFVIYYTPFWIMDLFRRRSRDVIAAD